MLDIRVIREQPDFVRERLATRGGDDAANIDEVLQVDLDRRRAETTLQLSLLCAVVALAAAGCAEVSSQNAGGTSPGQEPANGFSPDLQAMFVSSPMPSGAGLHDVGSGIFRLTVDPQGNVIDVKTVHTTEHGKLDNAAIKVLRTWKAKPGGLRTVDVPIRFIDPSGRLRAGPLGGIPPGLHACPAGAFVESLGEAL